MSDVAPNFLMPTLTRDAVSDIANGGNKRIALPDRHFLLPFHLATIWLEATL